MKKDELVVHQTYLHIFFKPLIVLTPTQMI